MHDQFGVGVIEDGAHRSLSGRGTVEATTGQLITVNPGEVHDGHPIDGEPRAWSMLYFSPGLARSLTDEIAQSGRPEYEFENPVLSHEELARHFRVLFRSLVAGQDALSEVLADQSLLMLFSQISRPSERVSEYRVPRSVERARELIDDDPTKGISLGDLANVSGLSRYQLIRGFSLLTGLTPHAYIIQRRLQLARRAIVHGHPLAETAASCGFADQSHMTRLFRRTYGVSPRALAS
jgi:AraC-like DNA-binding protein